MHGGVTMPGADPLVGRRVAQYEILARLGGGGMGVVYKARDTRLGRTVALKFLPPQWSHDEDARQRFVREAQAASATDHPNICTIHDIAAAEDGRLFIVMAFYEGETLKQRLERGPLPLDEAVDVATQIADGLARAHVQGVVHRDIKPGNVILTEDGARIVDFGLATFAGALQLTAAGSTLGTVAYMAPEQTRGEEVDARADVWAAGAVAYEMLAGRPPFLGTHAEAIAYAIRHDTPAPLREIRPEVPEEIEQVVFRALHKDKAIRYATGRELARALRQARGLSVPIELRTAPVVAPTGLSPGRRRRRSATRAMLAAAVALAAVSTWLMMPLDRVRVAVAPAVNRTGFPQLDGLEFTLLEELAVALGSSPFVRVASPARIREIARPFRDSGQATTPEALEALADNVGAEVVLVPVLLHERGEWRASLEIRRAAAGIAERTLSTPPVTSALLADAAYRLTLELAPLVEAHFAGRALVRGTVRRLLRTWTSPAPPPRFGTAEAARWFERGLDAYERLEYASAFDAFSAAADRQPDRALLQAWRSRTALLMRRDADALQAADRAERLLRPSTADEERLFVEAVVAEARRDQTTAEARYRALVALDEDDTGALIDYAGFLDRSGRDADAVLVYQRALALDPALPRPDLELCRLYGPTRLNERLRAKEHAARAEAKYAALGLDAGRAQVSMCLAEALREGDPAERREAARHAERARTLVGSAAPFQHSRALYYLGLTAYAERRFADAAALNEQALEAGRRVGNRALEPLLLANLGAAHLMLGNRRRHVEYTRTSAELFAARGENERAATLQANAGATLIDFGDDPVQGFRLVQNALTVFREARNTTGEVFALQVSAAYHRYRGEHAEAERLLQQALAISRQYGLKQRLWSLELDRLRSLYEIGEYETVRQRLMRDLPLAAGRDRAQGEILLALTETRLGDFEGARKRLVSVAAAAGANDETLHLLLAAARGELAYEANISAEARRWFDEAAARWTQEPPHARAVEALAYRGLLDGLRGDLGRAERALRQSLDRARLLGRLGLETRCRVFLARLAVERGRFDEAVRVLAEVPPDDAARTVGPELRAFVHYWRGRALAGLGDVKSRQELSAARRLVEDLRERLPDHGRKAFTARPDLRRILG